MWFKIKLRLNFKIKCLTIFLPLFLIILFIITIKHHSNNIRKNEILITQHDELIYLKQNHKYYANNEEESEKATVYQDCGDSNKIITLKYFDIKPEILSIPQNISLSIVFEILAEITKQLKISVSISRRLPFLGYVQLPCIKAKYGSCVYEHICDVYEWMQADSFEYSLVCPKWLQVTGFECKCPFKKGIYSIKATPAYISSTLIPNWLAKGDYVIYLTLKDINNINSGSNNTISSSTTVGCFKFMFHLT